MTLTFDQTLIDHFAEEGYKPEFGARELKRLIRSELETALAREMLGGGIGKGDHASARWDDKANAWCSNAKSHRRPRPSRSSRMPRRRATHLDGGRGCRVRPIGLALAWAASLASIAVAVVAAGHAGVYKRDPQSATPWGLLISGGTALPLASHPFA
ncbi:ATPase with chaperone activity, ATP-binding subunit [Klebsiella pneumoniae]|nr:ATPase with chaperone activity, ATP-binding subunit [Klebsiella pneumoniae]